MIAGMNWLEITLTAVLMGIASYRLYAFARDLDARDAKSRNPPEAP